jgi:hypothetical protein
MFNPSRAQVRQFFRDAWAQGTDATHASPLARLAYSVILEHPEYHALLSQPEAELHEADTAATGQMPPFLHLSLHLSVLEQLQIDQPPGIRSAWQALLGQLHDAHAVAHHFMDALAETLWEAQQQGGALSQQDYLARIQRCLKTGGG